MAEFQTVSAGVGFARDVIELIKYLKKVKDAMDTVEDDIDGLITELLALNSMYGKLEETCEQKPQDGLHDLQQRGLWDSLRKTLKEGKATFYKFDHELRAVYGGDPKVQGRLDALKKQHKLRSRASKLNEFRNQIHTYNGVLQVCLTNISLSNQDASREFQRSTSTQLREMMDGIRYLRDRLQASEQASSEHDAIPTFNDASIAALDRVTAGLKLHEQSSINKYFDVPRPVDSNYVGREDQAEKLADCFFPETQEQSQQQKRFVIYGVGGSGKTQFCCKFAQDHQQRFWGVFFIDGRSHSQLKQTLIQNVSRVAGVDRNHNAALNWLANQRECWLLIIDNADDASIDLMDYLPKGRRGYILITTRNPGFRSLGNVEPRYFKFDGLNHDEANALLFKTAEVSGLSDEAKSLAAKIVDALGRLALAIAVAGSAIREGVCYLHNYLQYFEDLWERRRVTRNLTKSTDNFDEKREARVETTFDISYEAIASNDSLESQDALELLKTFAFLHCENVRYKFLENCIRNAEKEASAQERKTQRSGPEEASSSSHTPSPPRAWSQYVADLGIQFWIALQGIRGPDILPRLLRDGRNHRDPESTYWRVQRAMTQLLQYSLVMHNPATDSWSMHPLIHRWAQKMIDMRVGEQYLWCEAAATLLCNCVYIDQIDEELMRELLPHVDEVRKEQKKVEQRLKDNRISRMKLWPVFEPSSSRRRTMMLVKFSLVYAYNGRWEDAEELQSVVQRFLVEVFGFRQLNTRRITRALAETLWHLGRSDDSAKLLEKLVEACVEYRGANDRETLVAIYKLGDSRWLQGRISEAKRLFEQSLSGLEKQYGNEDEDTLNAMDFLGKATLLYATEEAFAKAKNLHQATVRARTRKLAPDDLRVLNSRELLYSVATWTNYRQDLLDAEKGLSDIIEIRKAKLGREHAFTLLGILNLARVKIGLEDFKGAEEMFENCLPIAERNHGKDHVGVLFAYFCKGRMRCRERRWAEARDILVDVTERQKTCLQGWGRDHFDRLGGLLELIKAHDALGERAERNDAASEALRIFEKTTTVDHPWAKKLRAQVQEWKLQEAQAGPEDRAISAITQLKPPSSEEELESQRKAVVTANTGRK